MILLEKKKMSSCYVSKERDNLPSIFAVRTPAPEALQDNDRQEVTTPCMVELACSLAHLCFVMFFFFRYP